MKLIFVEYLASLKERGELDVIMPDLLSELGLSVISRPATGTKQYGVDVAAVGSDGDGNRKVFLLSIKPGDLRRSGWDVGPQSLRTSLNQILDVYVPNQIPKRYSNLPVVVVLCIGGELHEDVRTDVEGFIRQNTRDRISFDVWNGDRLADLLLSGILRENALPENSRSDLRKSIALADEPDASFGHFSRFVTAIVDQCKATRPARLTAIRRIYLGLWTLYVWSRTADNTEAAYLSSERAVLMAWHLVKNHIIGKSKPARQLIQSMERLISLHGLIADDYISRYVEPRARILHGLSSAVPSHASLDVNLRLFELVGRIGMRGHWLLHIADRLGQQGNADQQEAVRNALQSQAQLLADMIGNNPILRSPIKDSQATDINIACLFLDRVGYGDVIRQWIGQIAQATAFAFDSHAPYPCVYEEYGDLIEHPRDNAEYRNDATAGSILVPTLSVWAAATNDTETLGLLTDFVAGRYKHSTLQLLYPGTDTESLLYRGNVNHGLAFTDIAIKRSCKDVLSPIKAECNASREFWSLSAVTHGLWPLVILASRHHRVPVPPHFWPFPDETTEESY
ncbi:MAG: chemotaxis protein [Deltaproteobacteria bacterium]|nr:chemotaxis protein [Deltaproteobacteria bacterium]